MIKTKELSDPQSCLNRAYNDEPVFVVRAKDPLGALLVRIWATLASWNRCHPHERVIGAHAVANEMDAWRARSVPAKPSKKNEPTVDDVVADLERLRNAGKIIKYVVDTGERSVADPYPFGEANAIPGIPVEAMTDCDGVGREDEGTYQGRTGLDGNMPPVAPSLAQQLAAAIGEGLAMLDAGDQGLVKVLTIRRPGGFDRDGDDKLTPELIGLLSKIVPSDVTRLPVAKALAGIYGHNSPAGARTFKHWVGQPGTHLPTMSTAAAAGWYGVGADHYLRDAPRGYKPVDALRALAGC